MHPVSVQVSKTTIHGRAPQIFAVGVRMLRAAMRADPRLVAGLAAVLPELSAAGPAALDAEVVSAGMSPESTESRLYPVATAAETTGEDIASRTSPARAGDGLPVVDASAA